ncbi:MAG: cytochrome c3 family protein [Nitrospirota bacterium]
MKIVHFLKKRRTSLWPLISLFFIILLVSLTTYSFQKEGFAQEKAAKPEPQLTNSDCIKCHSKVQETVESKGSKHKTAISCMDCHRGHPPMVPKEQIIPACNDCHSGKPHYELAECASCHDPHAPLEMKLAANITDPCLTCHPGQGKEMKDNPSLHTNVACTMCHAAHKAIPECMTCHKPHSAEMVNKDCLTCHPAHQPLTITYGSDMPSKFCAPCHQNILDKLVLTKTKHSELECVFCHKEKHKMIPTCETCHGSPHPPALTAQFKKCNDCHISAHTLGKEVE